MRYVLLFVLSLALACGGSSASTKSGEQASSEIAERPKLAPSEQARDHLTIFASRAMPGMVFSDQQSAVLRALDEEPERFVRALWDSVGDAVKERVEFGEFESRTFKLGEQRFIVIYLPEPRAEGEPVLVAVQLEPTPLVFSLRQQGPDASHTMLLEERPDGVRSLGSGFDPNETEAFVKELAALARGDGTFKAGGTGQTADYRPHHYMFAHKYLPSVFYGDPKGFTQSLQNNPQPYLGMSWVAVGSDFDDEMRLPTPQFNVTSHSRPDGTIWVVEMPEPVAVPEAHFVAFALEPEPRVFTLEHGADSGDGPTPFFCAWEKDGTHSNWGRVDIDSAEDFAALIRAKIAENGAGTDAI